MNQDTLEKYLISTAAIKRTPISASMEILPLCNMDCEMCFVRLGKKEMESQGGLQTLEEWKQIADRMAEMGVIFLMLTGGEPLLYPDFKELYLYLRNLGMIVTVNTNATLIDDEWIAFFKENPPRRLNITLYGMCEETYETICHYGHGYKKVTDAIIKLRQAGIEIKINGSLVKANREEAEQMLVFADKYGCAINIDTHMQPAVRERKRPYNFQARLNPEDAADSSQKIMKLQLSEKYAEYRNRKMKEIEECQSIPDENCPQIGIKCQAGNTSFVINWMGKMMPCVMLNTIQADVQELGLQESWELIKKECDQIFLNSKCFNCKIRKLCATCPACGLHEAGAYDALPEYMCRYAERTYQNLLEEV